MIGYHVTMRRIGAKPYSQNRIKGTIPDDGSPVPIVGEIVTVGNDGERYEVIKVRKTTIMLWMNPKTGESGLPEPRTKAGTSDPTRLRRARH